MLRTIKEKLKESFFSVFPILVIVLILGYILKLPFYTMALFVLMCIFFIFGMFLFHLGVDLSMITIGEKIGASVMKSRKVWLILGISFFIGFIATVAEPDLLVLAEQLTTMPNYVIIGSVGIGVGIFAFISSLRLLYQWNLTTLLWIFYGILFLAIFFVPASFLPLSFDSGGVTTGPITVPFIMAFGLGLSAMRSDKASKEDSFGLIALCSIGPILAVLCLSFFFDTSSSYPVYETLELHGFEDIFLYFFRSLPKFLKEVSISMAPIVCFVAVYQFLTKEIKKKQQYRMICGFLFTFLGLVLFLTSVNVGFMPLAYAIGQTISSSAYAYCLIPIGGIIGYFLVVAEPAVQVLTEQVESVTNGSISKQSMRYSLSIGVALSVILSLIRVFTGISIIYILLPGYLLALVLSRFTPPIFTSIAFDSGGVASGTMTVTFLLPLAIGSCSAVGGNILTDAFGIIALVAMTPLVTIQLQGVIYQVKTKFQKPEIILDETIVDYDWRNS